MRIKDIVDENFQDYKKTSMFICTCFCDGKCYRELGLDPSTCQNEKIQSQPTFEVEDDKIVRRYIDNPITSAIIIGGLEPFAQYQEVLSLIEEFRKYTLDDIVLYTGFNKDEILDKIEELKKFPNIVIKYGRYIPNRPLRYDEVLGITLASDNQYAEKISGDGCK